VNQHKKKASAALASATRGARPTDVIRVNQHRKRKTSAALASASCLHGTPSPPAGFEPLTHLIDCLTISFVFSEAYMSNEQTCHGVHATCYMHMHEEMSPRLQPDN
jgi:hypothetical protein